MLVEGVPVQKELAAEGALELLWAPTGARWVGGGDVLVEGGFRGEGGVAFRAWEGGGRCVPAWGRRSVDGREVLVEGLLAFKLRATFGAWEGGRWRGGGSTPRCSDGGVGTGVVLV